LAAVGLGAVLAVVAATSIASADDLAKPIRFETARSGSS
jgi:hypothetical protein